MIGPEICNNLFCSRARNLLTAVVWILVAISFLGLRKEHEFAGILVFFVGSIAILAVFVVWGLIHAKHSIQRKKHHRLIFDF